MAKVTVDHSRFNEAANEIESYVQQTKNKMRRIDQTVTELGSSWQGSDYRAVHAEWDQINGKNSTTDKMLTSLQDYANALKNAGNKYKSAQTKAINRAKLLCK